MTLLGAVTVNVRFKDALNFTLELACSYSPAAS